MSDVRPPAVDASLGELFSDLTTDLSGLIRDELELAKVELKEEISKVGRAGGMFGARGARRLHDHRAALVRRRVGTRRAHGSRVGIPHRRRDVGSGGRPAVPPRPRPAPARCDLKPEQTIDTLKEDIQWAKNQKP